MKVTPNLRKLFQQELKSSSRVNRDPLHRGFIKWYVRTRFGADAKCDVTDGPSDGGIDAIVTEPRARGKAVWVVQSKFTDSFWSGRESKLALTDYTTFDSMPSRFRDDGAFDEWLDTVADELKPKYRDLRRQLDSPDVFVGWHLVTLHGRSRTGEDRLQSLGPDTFIYGEQCLQLYLMSREGATPPADPLVLTFTKSMIVEDRNRGVTSYVFAACLKDFVDFMDHDTEDRLFARNVRLDLKSKINKDIRATYVGSPHEFWYSHNGITVVCTKAVIEGQSVRLVNPSVINGSQTLHSLKGVNRRDPEAQVLTRVLVVKPERIADLQYRDALEFAVGHGTSAHSVVESGMCRRVETTWMPRCEVERVEPAVMPDVELGMEALAAMPDAAVMRAALATLPSQYKGWIEAQSQNLPPDPRRIEVAQELLRAANRAANRIDDGLSLLDDPPVFEAFTLANRAMAMAARQRRAQETGKDPNQVAVPSWRPFQLAFVLMNLRAFVTPSHPDRELVDLLFFPTGGGKTEAYLGLAAFVILLRRLREPGLESAGVTVLMRYTLRLLTLDQLSRAATLMCALEIIRQERGVERLGAWPFEIGLWVGKAATPNRMGKRGEKDRTTARAKTVAFQNNSKRAAPIPMENCPWCGEKFKPYSFRLVPSTDQPTDLRIACVNPTCRFRGGNPLPMVAVDEPLFRRLPCFVIATVDKFASLPWVGPSGVLLGGAERHDAAGFYGAATPGVGQRLTHPLPPPDLIIQDELHLISGPLGTMAGLYETAIDALTTRQSDGHQVRPKILASTATVRRATDQIRALFGRNGVEVFPPPGPDRRDSFFAQTKSLANQSGRLYIGLAAQGHSLKKLLLRSYLALLGAAQKAWDAQGGSKSDANSADPYMTLVGYFNSLRELGGSRRIVEDEVASRVSAYSGQKRQNEIEGSFADRDIAREVSELTSRESTNRVSDTKRKLALPFADKEHVDVALATNMISVGLDITRLGLMVVLGQPKAAAEYIQATNQISSCLTWSVPVSMTPVWSCFVQPDRRESMPQSFSTWARSIERWASQMAPLPLQIVQTR